MAPCSQTARTVQLFAFAGEEQNAGRAGRVRNRAEQDLGQAVRGPGGRQRAHDLMRADGVDSCRARRDEVAAE